MLGGSPNGCSGGQWVVKYAADQNAFFADYAVSHKKLSELGSKFVPAGGIRV